MVQHTFRRIKLPKVSGILLALSWVAVPHAVRAQEAQDSHPSDLSSVTATQAFDPASLYRLARPAVVRVISGLSQGSGFIVEDPALGKVVLTNAHVADSDTGLSVVFEDTLRLPARILYREPAYDLAVLESRTDLCDSCQVLRLAREESLEEAAVLGTPVMAIGYPLGLRRTVTTGVIAGATPRFLLTDVNINSGNSGGPLLGIDGTVLGVNTFVLPSAVGPGLSGTVRVSMVHEFLAEARETPHSEPLPPGFSEPLPSLHALPYPMVELQAAADSVEFKEYKKYGDLDTPDFNVTIYTPVSLLAFAAEVERQVSKRRREREWQHGVLPLDWYTERSEFHSWFEELGELTRPLVMIRFTPKFGKTGATVANELLGAVVGAAATMALNTPYVASSTPQDYEFKGDMGSASILRYEVDRVASKWAVVRMDSVPPLIGGTRPLRVFVGGNWVQFKDVAYEGLFILSPETFRPSPSGRPPSVVFDIRDLTNSDVGRHPPFELPREVTARIWNDFRPYYAKVLAETTPVSDKDQFKSVCSVLPKTEDRYGRNRDSCDRM